MSDVVESDAEVSDSDVDSADDVSMLDAEEDAAEEVEEAAAEEVEQAEEEEESAMDGDPTRFGGENFSSQFVPASQIP